MKTSTQTVQTTKEKPPKGRHTGRWILLALGAVLMILLVVLGCCILRALNDPQALFNAAALTMPDPTPQEQTDSSKAYVPAVTLAPNEDGEAQTPKTLVNVLLLGIDRTEAGGTSSGTMPHTDAILVAAVNFAEGRVDLISLPRDTFSNIPGINGVYKLNGIFNYGGGYDTPDKAFGAVLSAAEWMLGGVTVDYYYALDFEAVVKIVDAIGGVDFDVDISFSGYHKGLQHLDGEGVLLYLRARTNASANATDAGRVDRQKRMMVAIFKKLKSEGKLSMVPALISAADSGIYTNTTAAQTLALVNFAMQNNLPEIGQYSLSGKYRGALDWNFTFPDQENRVAVIKTVYGITVEQDVTMTYEYALWMGEAGFSAIRCLKTAEALLAYVEQLSPSDELRPLKSAFMAAYEAAAAARDTAARSLTEADTAILLTALTELREAAASLAEQTAYPDTLKWTYSRYWYEDSGINEVYVDFR